MGQDIEETLTNNTQSHFITRVKNKIAALPPERIIQTEPFLIFWSKGNPDVNLNGHFFDKENERIVCRHLAPAQVFYDEALFKNKYHDTFINPKKIPSLNDNEFDNRNFRSDADSYHLIKKENIGYELTQISKKIQESHHCRILFRNDMHVMSIKIKNKGADGFVIQFYDPNKTLVHKHIWFPDVASIASLQLSDLLDVDLINLYFPTLNGFFAIYSESRSLNNKNHSISHTIGRDVPHIDQFYFGLELEHEPWVWDSMNKVLNSDLLTLDEKMGFLCNENKFALPSLFLALQNGHHNSVSKYTQLLNLSDEKKATFLTCKLKDGTPGLFFALQNGHHLAVIEYVKYILASELSDKQKKKLLACKNADGVPGLLISLQKGNYDLADEYMQCISNSNLDNRQKQELLAGKDNNGNPALFTLLKNYSSQQAVATYLQCILNSNLNDMQKENLLLCKDADGIPGIYTACRKRDYKCMAIYFTHIQKLKPENIYHFITSLLSNLPVTQKNEVLQAIKSNCLPGSNLHNCLEKIGPLIEIESVAFNYNSSPSKRNLNCIKLDIHNKLTNILCNENIPIQDKIKVCCNAINPQNEIGKILFSYEKRFYSSFFSLAQPRLTAGTLHQVMELIEQELIPQIINTDLKNIEMLQSELRVIRNYMQIIRKEPESLIRLNKMINYINDLSMNVNLRWIPDNQYATNLAR